MSRSRRPWASNSRRDDRKRDDRDEFDLKFDEFIQKKKREVSDFKADNDRLSADNRRLRAELNRKDAELERQTKKFKAALESVFAVLTAPAKNEDTDSTSEQGGDGAAFGRGEDPLRPTPSEDATANGPGEAAPGPPQREEEEATMQDEERPAHSTRNEIPEMPQL